MKRTVAPPPPVHHTQLSQARDSFQTLSSSDTATQYPRREVRSAWAAENTLEITALEEYQEAMKNPTSLSTEPVRVDRKKKCSKPKVMSITLFISIVLITIIGVGTAGGAGGNEDEPAQDPFNEQQFREICLNAIEGAPNFGICLPDGQAGFCVNRQVAVLLEDADFCQTFGFVNGACQCSRGQLIEVIAGSELCQLDTQCTPVDLSEITQPATGSQPAEPQSVAEPGL